ncbi:hypothetical protein MKW92_050106 [Papaver armeniacum]|nr:hypothetical protein MKW92_050106 [Papaver armeniacum]
MKNNEKLTPGTLFSREHKDLVKEAERWMKDMAQACIIVTTLIATVMFAAAFQHLKCLESITGGAYTTDAHVGNQYRCWSRGNPCGLDSHSSFKCSF